MKKILTIISVLALGLTVGQAQMTGPGDGTGTGDGPQGTNGGMWPYIEENATGEILEAYNVVIGLRETLKDSRAAYLADNGSLEGWFETEAANIELLKTNVDLLRDWYRETRPDRPDPVNNGDMIQRRDQFRTQSQVIAHNRETLRLHGDDPQYAEECTRAREEIQNQIQERKQTMRNQRTGEGGSGGEGSGQRGG